MSKTTPKSQKTLTSFFSKVKRAGDEEKKEEPPKPKVEEKTEVTVLKEVNGKPESDASPIKAKHEKKTKKKTVIASDSEEDVADDVKENKEEKSPSPVKKPKATEEVKPSPKVKAVAKPDTNSEDKECPVTSPPSSIPRRKTARKNMSRKANSNEDEQLKAIEELKTKKEKTDDKPDQKKKSRKSVEKEVVESPVKATKKKKKAVIESDSEEEEVLEKEPEQTDEHEIEEEEMDTSEIDTSKVDDTVCDEKVKNGENKKANKENKKRKSEQEIKPQTTKKIKPETKEKESKGSPSPSKSPSNNKKKEDEADKPAKKQSHPFFNMKSSKDKSSEESTGDKSAKKSGKPADPQLEYDVTKANYHPIDDACWKHGDKVPYLALARTFEVIEETSGRIKTINMLSNLLRSVIVLTPEDLLPCIYLCLNKTAPAWEGSELGIGEYSLIKAVAQATGRGIDKIKADLNVKGDLGIVAEGSKSSQRTLFQPPKLTLRGVFKTLKEIAEMSGHSVITKKVDMINKMLVACRGAEPRFIIRSLSGKLRIGLAEQSVLQALAQACVDTPPGQSYPPDVLNASKGKSPEKFKKLVDEEALIIKTTFCECPNYNLIISALLEHGVKNLPDICKLTPGIPLKPMLAHPTKGISEVMRRFEDQKFTCEYKYDGERAQIHLSEDGTINIYSRNQENNTSKYPDIIKRLPQSLQPTVKSCIIDSEAVAWDTENKTILPFQVLSTRKRKDADESEIKVQVCVYAFDLLYLNGKSLVKETLQHRRDLLHEHLKEVPGEMVLVTASDSNNTEDISEFLELSIKGNCEGLMVKALTENATYEIAKRSHNWLKVKKDYLEGVGDTLDVVVIGGFRGKGKRAGSYGGFLLACYDEENEEFQSICKIGTGFTDEDLDKHTEFLKEHVIEKPKSYYRWLSGVEPDVWFESVQVWEIKAADLSISPVHQAARGIVDPEKGISLRFPRFLRIRDDKTPEQATSATQVAEMYNNQDQVKNRLDTKTTQDEEDFY